jgi:NADPH:quinone reductase-like Zn-dependent oxidoreductase
LGADDVIDHYSEKIATRVKELTQRRGVDLIFEHVGAKVWDECLKSLAWGGTLVTCGATSGPQVSLDLRHIFIKQQKIIGSTMGTRAEVLAIHDFLACGQLKVVLDKTFAYTDVAAAHERLEQSKNFGKIILSW